MLHVMVGVLWDANGRILISRRHGNVHLSGFWEFPGGKLHDGEHPAEGLARELCEELGVQVQKAQPLMQVRHHFEDRSVLLDVWNVERFTGNAHGREGQETAWVAPSELQKYRFPESNQAILRTLQLPRRYAITPDLADAEAILAAVRAYLDVGVSLVQFRAPQLGQHAWIKTARAAVSLCEQRNAKLLVNSPQAALGEVGAHGTHLKAAQLSELAERANFHGSWLAASCHRAEDLELARALGLDFVTLSPVMETASHPGQAGIGWERFSELASSSSLPVFALGGMCPGDLDFARSKGAWGIAGIRGLAQVP